MRIALALAIFAATVSAQELPRWQVSQLVFEGALVIPHTDEAPMDRAAGALAFTADGHMLVMGRGNAAATLEVPATLGSSADPEQLPKISAQWTQSMRGIKPPYRHEPVPNTLMGIGIVGRALISNWTPFYPGSPKPHDSTTVMANADAMGAPGPWMTMDRVEGSDDWVSPSLYGGWVTPIPPEWQAKLGGKWLCGASGGLPISARFNAGPTAAVCDAEAMVRGEMHPVRPLLSTRLANADTIHGGGGDAQMWTHVSRAAYGVILPGTRTYLVVGFSGGHHSGIGYKTLSSSNPNGCPYQNGGYCIKDPQDAYAYYWLYDVDEMLASPGTATPYDHGEWPAQYYAASDAVHGAFSGAAIDPATGKLWTGSVNALHPTHWRDRHTKMPVYARYNLGLDAPVVVEPPAVDPRDERIAELEQRLGQVEAEAAAAKAVIDAVRAALP